MLGSDECVVTSKTIENPSPWGDDPRVPND